MTKTKTWKENRDLRRENTESGDMIDVGVLRDLIDEAKWEVIWLDDYSQPGQMAWLGAMRRGYDECAPVAWKVFEGWGENKCLVLKSSIEQFKDILKNPPPPRMMSDDRVLGDPEPKPEVIDYSAHPPIKKWDPSMRKARRG